MGSKANASAALLLSLNLLLFSMVSSSNLPMTKKDTCSIDILKLSVCADILHLITPGSKTCCSLIEGLVDLEAALCLCTAIKLNILGIIIDTPIALSLVLNFCGKSKPSDFQCS